LALLALSVGLALAPATPALALMCPTGHVVWIKAYNSADGTYKEVYWQGGSQYFAGTGTDYINTGRMANSYASVSSNSTTAWVEEFCVRDGVNR
jgi:hypothetical protein